MASAEVILSILKRGAQWGPESLTPAERKVWLISEAEVFCDMEGIPSFLDQYSDSLPEVAEAFAEAGAIQIADSLREIHARLPERPSDLLANVNTLVTARSGYDRCSVLRLVCG
jgi:hypothetical protein